MWGRLPPTEQAGLIALLVERVEYRGAGGTVPVSSSPTGLAAWPRNAHRSRRMNSTRPTITSKLHLGRGQHGRVEMKPQAPAHATPGPAPSALVPRIARLKALG